MDEARRQQIENDPKYKKFSDDAHELSIALVRFLADRKTSPAIDTAALITVLSGYISMLPQEERINMAKAITRAIFDIAGCAISLSEVPTDGRSIKDILASIPAKGGTA